MVTMYFLFVWAYSTSNPVLPHELPLFASLESCNKTAKILENVIPSSAKVKCVPIEVIKGSR